MSVEKKVVLCVPIHNASLTLRETLDSLVAQDYPIYKIKLFNNASTDSTADIIKGFCELHKNIEVYAYELLVSAEENFTNCIRAAEGDFCAIVHSDDVYEKNFISSAVRLFSQDTDCVGVFSHAREIDIEGNVIGERFVPSFLKNGPTFMGFRELLRATLNYSNFLTCPSAVVHSDVYREVVKYWNGRDFKTSADLDVWLRISKTGKICFNPEPLMRYRVATTSLSFRMAKTRTNKHDLFLVLSKYVRENMDWLTEENLDDYKFLNYKDEAFRIINSYKNKHDLSLLGKLQRIEWAVILRRLFRSKWHLKIAAGILLSRIVLMVKGYSWQRKLS